MSTESDKVREYLSRFILLDDTLHELQNPRNSSDFKKALQQLTALEKKMDFSQKIRNFASAKQSEYEKFKLFEYGSVCFNFWSEAMGSKMTDPEQSAVFTALLGASKGDFPFYSSLLPLENSAERFPETDK